MATSLPLHLLDSNAHSEVSEPEKPHSCERDKFSRKQCQGMPRSFSLVPCEATEGQHP